MPLKIMPMLILKLNSNDIEIIENETKEINDDKKENINDININENIIQKENKLITNTKDTNFDFSDSRHLGFDFSAINVK
jgi:hypothetical protein